MRSVSDVFFFLTVLVVSLLILPPARFVAVVFWDALLFTGHSRSVRLPVTVGPFVYEARNSRGGYAREGGRGRKIKTMTRRTSRRARPLQKQSPYAAAC